MQDVEQSYDASNAFESFNARAATATQVASTFIPPAHFETLARRAHTLVVGPRGSGKTTLLKMLTPEALQTWRHPLAQKFRERIDFAGVFVPTDIMWTKQLTSISDDRRIFSEDEASLFTSASFTVAVFRAFTSTLIQRVKPSANSVSPFRALNLSLDEEAGLTSELADAWGVSLRIRSLAGLRAGLGAMLSQVASLVSAERMRANEGRAERLAEVGLLHRDMIAGLSDALDRLAIFLPDAEGERWAIMFDELELAPPAVRERLLSALRSVDQRLLFKLCISPYSAELSQLQDAMSAMPGNDHDEISLSYGHKEDARDFTIELMTAVLRGRGWPTDEPRVALGGSDFDLEPSGATIQEESKYRPGSRFMRFARQLEQDDASFARYLGSQGLAVSKLLALDGNRRAQALRKIMPIIVVRSAYRSADSVYEATGRRYKSRKAPDIYRGLDSLCAMLEGNPRWIIGVMTSLTTGDQRSDSTIPTSRQTRELARTANRFRALLTAIPSEVRLGNGRRGILPLIDEIGFQFKERVIGEDFTPDPVGTLIVDSNASSQLVDAVGSAVNVGALIYVPDPGGAAILSSLRGKRFRLTYLFAPTYCLAPRLERGVSLLGLLSSESKRSVGLSQDFLVAPRQGDSR